MFGERSAPRPGRRQRRLHFESLESRRLFAVTPTLLPGDSNGDGLVNALDIAATTSNWFGRPQEYIPAGDANDDGIVNARDLTIVTGNWLARTTAGKSAGDLNGDGTVNVQDLSLIAGSWLTERHTPPLVGDANGDGLVNAADLGAIASRWKSTLFPSGVVPQPAIHLDAGDRTSLTTQGAAQFVAAKQQYLQGTADPELGTTTQMTVAFRADQMTLGLDRTFVSQWQFGSTGSWAIDTGAHYLDDGEISFWFAGANGKDGTIVYTQGANVKAGFDTAIAVVFDGTQAVMADRLKIYVNGVQQTTKIENGQIPTSLNTTTAPVTVGSWPGLGRYLDANMQHLGIWNVALGAAQIGLLQNNSLTYLQLPVAVKTGLQAWWDLDETSGVRVDKVTGSELADPTRVGSVSLVKRWVDPQGYLDLTTSPRGSSPTYVPISPLGGQPAIAFNGLNDALKMSADMLPADETGDIFLVVEFASNSPDGLEGDTIFSSSSDTTAVDYLFFSVFNPNPSLNIPGTDGKPHFRIRFRDDFFQTDVRGSTPVEAGVPYVLHVWGLGAGNGYGMTINGLNQSFLTTSPQPLIVGGWFSGVPNRTNVTLGNFERIDGAQGYAAMWLGEVLLFRGTTAQPRLSDGDAALITSYLMAKYGASPLTR